MLAENEAGVPVTDDYCPICARALKRPSKAKELYGFRVCKKCRNGFANRRQGAFLVDWIILLWFPVVVILYLEDFFLGPPSPTPLLLEYLGLDRAVGFIITWIVPLLFYCKDGFGGMSLGKWIMGVQVVDVNTREPVGAKQSFKRNLVFLIPLSVLVVALTMMKGRRWGDRWAHTVVIRRKYAFKAPFDPRGILCIECGYNLTGNVSGRCPECFTPIPASGGPDLGGTT